MHKFGENMTKQKEISPQVRKYIIWLSVGASCLLPLVIALIYGNIQDRDGLFKYLGIGLVVLLGYLVQIYTFSNDNKFKTENNDFLITEECSKIKSKFLNQMLGVGFLNLIMFLILNIDPSFSLDLIEKENVIYIVSAIGALLFVVLMNKITATSKKAIIPSNRWSVLIVLGLLNFAFLVNLIPFINKSLTSGKETEVILSLKNPHEVQADNKWKWCLDYYIKDVPDFQTSFNFCNDQYAGMRLDYPLSAKMHKGLFGLRFINEIKAPAQNDFESFLKYVQGEKNLRSSDLFQFDSINGRDSHFSISKKWEEQCNEKYPHFCRLAAYLYDLSKDNQRKVDLLKKGCSFNEFLSCAGLFYSADPNVDEQLKYAGIIINMCDSQIDVPQIDGVQMCGFYKEFQKNHQTKKIN